MDFGQQMDAINTAVDDTLTTAEEKAAIHTPSTGPEQTGIKVIALDPFEAEGSDRGSKLIVSVTASQFTTVPARSDGMTIGGIDYLIRNINADQGGRLELTLEKYTG